VPFHASSDWRGTTRPCLRAIATERFRLRSWLGAGSMDAPVLVVHGQLIRGDDRAAVGGIEACEDGALDKLGTEPGDRLALARRRDLGDDDTAAEGAAGARQAERQLL